jgi:hypothetical protein
MGRARSRSADAAQIKLLVRLWAQAHFGDDPSPGLVSGNDEYDMALEATIAEGDLRRKPIATQRFDLATGPHELSAWLPGPHPRLAIWWDAMDVWILLRQVLR